MNYIFSTYFTSKKDPQRSHHWKINDVKIYERWYNSLKSLKLKAIIFHDELSKEFVSANTDDFIKFVRCNKDYQWSTNDFRFAVYLYYLKLHPEIENVFMTDISDVIIKQNPFNYIESNTIYSGYDRIVEPIYQCKWKVIQGQGGVTKFQNFWNTLKTEKVINAGVCGGHRDIIVKFLEKMVEEFEKINTPGKNNNMAVYNYVAYKYFKDYLKLGEPVCSKFGKKEIKREDVWFIHK